MIENYKYTDKEKKQLIESMIILVDTREKENKHILDYFDKKKIGYKKKALGQGDYSFIIPANEDLSIPRDLYFDKDVMLERKGSLEELSGNLAQNRDRFEKELSLSPVDKVLMIENASYKDIADGNYKTNFNRKSFLGSLHKFWFKYDLPFFFVPDKKYSGLFIRMYFECYLKNLLR